MGSSNPPFPVVSQSSSEIVPELALPEGKLKIPEIDVIKYGNCIDAISKRNLEDPQCELVIERSVSKRVKVQGHEEKETDDDFNFEAINPKTTGAVKASTSNHAAADVINVDDHNERGSQLTEDSPINLSKTKVGKYMQCVDKDGYNLLGEYLQKTGNGVPLWECEIAAVYKMDIVSLVQDSTVRSNVIDSFSTTLGRKQARHAERQTQSHFMPSYCWEFISAGKYDRLRLMLYDNLLKNLGRADFFFFPLTHKRQYHFTLLILNMVEGTWHHYNPLLPRGGAKRDPCFVEAKKLHKEVSNFMKYNKVNADQVLSTTMVRREFLGDGKPYSVSVPLRDDEKEAFQFLKNAEVEYPLVPSPVCPQQRETSVNCGVAVMYFMEHVSEGRVMDNQFEDIDMTRMRARVISCFLNGPKYLEIDYPEDRNGEIDYPEEHNRGEDEFLEKEDGGGSSSTQWFTKRTPEVLERMHPLTTSEKAIALDRGTIGFHSENPYFKVTIRPSYIRQSFLGFPLDFARRHLKQPAGIVILGVSNRTKTWTVKFKYDKSRAIFQLGWLAFVKDNNLNVDDVCVFTLINKSIFLFKVVVLRTIEAANCSLSPDEDLPIQFKDGGVSSTQRFLKQTHEGLGRMHTLTSSEKNIALERGAIAFQSENPYFKVAIQPSYIQKNCLHFPREFAERYLKLPACNVILGVSNGSRTWSVKFKYEKSRALFRSGWLAFARANNLKVGDVCVFELIDKIKLLFEVVFSRTTAAAHLPLSPGYGRGAIDQVKI